MKYLEDAVFEGFWAISGRPHGRNERFSLIIGPVDKKNFTGLIFDEHGAFHAEGVISRGFISFRKDEGVIAGRQVYARYQGKIEEEDNRYKVVGTWQFSADESIYGRFQLIQKLSEQKTL